MKSGLFWSCIVASLAVAFGHGDDKHGDLHSHSHDNEDGVRSCDAHERSLDAMKSDEQYYKNYMREKKRADMYQRRMKLLKDHQFRSEKLMNHDQLLNADDRRKLYDDYENGIADEPVITIPVVFHVLYSNDDENLSNDQLDSQIDVLNKDFRANTEEINDGEVDSIWRSRIGDTKIEFYRAGVERVSIAGKGSSFCDSDSNIKQSDNGGSDSWDPYTYLNFWICDIGGLGYAYYPCLLGTSSEWKDGVVVTSGAVGSRDDDDGTFYFGYNSYDLGRTASHEIGHYLAMPHVWGESQSCSVDDGIDDTPLQYGPNYGCPSNDPDSCDAIDSESGIDLPDMTINIMDYGDDRCIFVFTEEQSWTMRSVLKNCRISMYNNGASDEATVQPQTTNEGYEGFECNDGCELPDDYIDDGYCDCSNCEDETYWGCNNCTSTGDACAISCGEWTYCTGETTNVNNTNSNSTGGYYVDCYDGCSISIGYINDGYCDCSTCEDESSWTCSNCEEGCPNGCGNFTWCGSDFGTTTMPIYTTDEPTYFYCLDGCTIFYIFHNDGWCDCDLCEDETYWECDTCSSYGCPNCTLGEYVGCDGTGYNGNDTFFCDNGCGIDIMYYNDSWCDCSNCEDEIYWTCNSCGGCPDFYSCGDYVRCNITNALPTTTSFDTTSYTTRSGYECDDGCIISPYYVNDGWCDCSDCDDESDYTCATCPGCPSACGGTVLCYGVDYTTTSYAFGTTSNYTTGSGYECDDGCTIPSGYVNDGYCDCTDCDDESGYTCATCPGCPSTCDDYVYCNGTGTYYTTSTNGAGTGDTTSSDDTASDYTTTDGDDDDSNTDSSDDSNDATTLIGWNSVVVALAYSVIVKFS